MPQANPDAFDVIILGGGAAGLMCAIGAGRRGRRALVLERSDRVASKILISGGGRCNFTNLRCTAENFLSENPHFAKSALARFTPADFIAMVERHTISYHEKTLGQLFCDRSSRDIINLLEAECAEAKVHIQLGQQVNSIAREDAFAVRTAAGSFRAPSLVVATGGLSIPKLGATDFGYRIAEQFGLRLVDPRPALVPLTFDPTDQAEWCDLSGLSTEVVASAGLPPRQGSFREKLLITHRGLSGPAALQISSFWRPGQQVSVDLVPGNEVTRPLLARNAARDSRALYDVLRGHLPARLAERWITLTEPADWTNSGLAVVEHRLHHWQVTPAGTEGYAKAEVTAGGVSTAELDARTMQSLKIPGLYFIGEVVDVTGWLGGYNFQWAWASGAAAGRAV